jgi:RNA polymerase sigma-70 factor (ECF subfamily)
MAAEPRTKAASGAPSSNGRSVCAPAKSAGDGVLRLVELTNDSAHGPGWLQSIVDRFEGPLIRYAARITGDLERGRDVVQETFLRLCREPEVAAGDHLAQWLFTVCRRLAIDVRRKETRMHTQDETAVCDLPAREIGPTRIECLEQHDEVSRLVDALPTNQQEVVRLKFQEGMSYKAIAEITGLSVSNVGYLLHTAVKALRERMTS